MVKHVEMLMISLCILCIKSSVVWYLVCIRFTAQLWSYVFISLWLLLPWIWLMIKNLRGTSSFLLLSAFSSYIVTHYIFPDLVKKRSENFLRCARNLSHQSTWYRLSQLSWPSRHLCRMQISQEWLRIPGWFWLNDTGPTHWGWWESYIRWHINGLHLYSKTIYWFLNGHYFCYCIVTKKLHTLPLRPQKLLPLRPQFWLQNQNAEKKL